MPGPESSTTSKAPSSARYTTKAISCAPCRKSHVRCDRTFPCKRCKKLGLECIDPQRPDGGCEDIADSIHAAMHEGQPVDLLSIHRSWSQSSDKKKRALNGAQIFRMLRAMERIRTRRFAKKAVVNNIITSLTTSMHGLTLDDEVSGTQSFDCGLSMNLSDAGPLQLPYRHGSPSTALHPCLAELYAPPFVGMCFAAIDGDERIYCNQTFENMFLSEEECNRRLSNGCQSPTKDIFGDILETNERQWLDRMFDECLFFSQTNPSESCQVLKVTARGGDKKEHVAHVRARIMLSEDGEYFGIGVGLQLLPLPIELFRRMPAWRSPMTAEGNPFLGKFFDDPSIPSISPLLGTQMGKRRGGGDIFEMLQSSHAPKAIKMGQEWLPASTSPVLPPSSSPALPPSSSSYLPSQTTTSNALVPAAAGGNLMVNDHEVTTTSDTASTDAILVSKYQEQWTEDPGMGIGQGWLPPSTIPSPVYSSCTTVSTTSSTCGDNDHSGLMMGQSWLPPPSSSSAASPPSFSSAHVTSGGGAVCTTPEWGGNVDVIASGDEYMHNPVAASSGGMPKTSYVNPSSPPLPPQTNATPEYWNLPSGFQPF